MRYKWEEHYTEEEFREALADTDRWDELSEIYGEVSIYNWRKRMGIHIDERKPKKISHVDPELLEELLWDYNYTVSEIASELDVMPKTVKRYCEYREVPIPPREIWKRHFTEEELVSLLRKGLPGFRILQGKTGYDRTTYYRLRKKYLKDS